MKNVFIILLIITSLLAWSQPPSFDLKLTPFSCAGAWTALSVVDEKEKGENLYIRDICGRRLWNNDKVFMIEPISDNSVQKATFKANALEVTVTTTSGRLEICYENPDVLRFHGKGTGMRLTMTCPRDGSSLVIPLQTGQWRLQMGGFPHFVFTTLRGEAKMIKGSRYTINLINGKERDKPIEMVLELHPGMNGEFDAAFENYDCGWTPVKYSLSFDECLKNRETDFNQWCSNMPQPLAQYEKTWKFANYINWSCIVNPRGNIDVPMMLSSKNNMHALWTWDTWFFCIATSYKMPEFAWNACMFHANHQDKKTGLIPNLSTDVTNMWGFGYPCIWGWALRKMTEHDQAIGSIENLQKIYEPLCKATDYWFIYQDDDKNGIPQYNHTNDAGMDNSTAGDIGMSLESPDLAAYLVVQMDVLAEIAGKLNKPEESKNWKQRADELLSKMIRELWTGEHFIARRTDDHKFNEKSQSILLYMPLILGKRLPSDISSKMIRDLKTNGMFTEVGLCSENPKGDLYAEDSYWRGPVWSPPTYIIASGIKECGDMDFAKEIAKRYCDNCVKNGFGENFDPFTGHSLKDRSLPWTAAIFVILQEDFLK